MHSEYAVRRAIISDLETIVAFTVAEARDALLARPLREESGGSHHALLALQVRALDLVMG